MQKDNTQPTKNINNNMQTNPLNKFSSSLTSEELQHQDNELNDRLTARTDDRKTLDIESETAVQQKVKLIAGLINQNILFVSKQILGRKEIIKQSFLALMTGEHQIFISRTGMAKSLLARQIFSCFKEARIFEKQLTKDTMPENLFGAYDIEEMKKGRMVHNIEGSMVLSHFAFLDEIFDANDMLLRSLLTLLNEKKLVNGEQVVSSTLHSAIAAANYVRVTEVLEAVIDRFMYKAVILKNNDSYFQYSIDQIYQDHFGKVSRPEKRLPLSALSFIKQLIHTKEILIPGYILFLKNHILSKYIEETRNMVSDKKDYTISARKSVKIQDTMRASAILDGRLQVEEKDIDSLFYAVCVLGRDDQKTRIKNITSSAKNYFRQDREILENIFNAISILNIIKHNNNNETLKSDDTLNEIKNRLEKVVRMKGSVFKEYFSRLKHKVMSVSRDTYIHETFTMLDSICELSLKGAETRESKEIISGFREDIFNEKNIFKF